ncbi:hypothetical protein CVS40_10318 [Lucilia cuprina]|nr:hypothetical protein CVS40_10318 [Lucilia cuprina]
MTSDKMKARYDRAVNSEGFSEGQLVLLYSPHRKKVYLPNCKPTGKDRMWLLTNKTTWSTEYRNMREREAK